MLVCVCVCVSVSVCVCVCVSVCECVCIAANYGNVEFVEHSGRQNIAAESAGRERRNWKVNIKLIAINLIELSLIRVMDKWPCAGNFTVFLFSVDFPSIGLIQLTLIQFN